MFVKKRYISIVMVLGFACSTALAFAESGSAVRREGRTEDGKAYRIDKDGLRIVDELAELRLEVNELRRELIVMRIDVASKKKKIRELKKELKVDKKSRARLGTDTPAKSVKANCKCSENALPTAISSLPDSGDAAPVVAESDTIVLSEEHLKYVDMLAKIQNKILKRKSIFDRIREETADFSGSLSNLVSSDGTSLDSYRTQISNLSEEQSPNPEKLSAISSGLKQIHDVLTSDIKELETTP